MIPSSISITIGFVLLYQATTLSDLLIAAALYGMGTGSLFPSLQAWTLNNTKPEQFTKVTAMFFNSFDLGIGGGSAILGLIAVKKQAIVPFIYFQLSSWYFFPSCLLFRIIYQ
ncbi:hypothetical protein GCM10020331_072330 [Ectobacillus funiculus]